MSSLQPTIRAALTKFCQDNDGKETASDILRAIHEEAYLMKETQDLKDTLDMDPMEQFRDSNVKSQIDRMKQTLQVTSCRRVWTGPYPDYCSINTVVTFTKPNPNPSKASDSSDDSCSSSSINGSENMILQLTFRYERKKRLDIRDGCHVWYSIETSRDYGPKENLLVVQVWAQSSSPSGKRAICMNQHYDDDEEEGGWEDMDEDDEQAEEKAAIADVDKNEQTNNGAEIIPADDDYSMEETSSSSSRKVAKKKQKVNGSHTDDKKPESESKTTNGSGGGNGVVDEAGSNEGFEVGDEDGNDVDDDDDDNNGSSRDSYTAYLDPDILHEFLDWNEFTMHDGTAFFLLMTFPYYEHEWDLVGFVLDEVFGGSDDDDDHCDNDDNKE